MGTIGRPRSGNINFVGGWKARKRLARSDNFAALIEPFGERSNPLDIGDSPRSYHTANALQSNATPRLQLRHSHDDRPGRDRGTGPGPGYKRHKRT